MGRNLRPLVALGVRYLYARTRLSGGSVYSTQQLALAALLAVPIACATPVGVDRVSPREVQRELTESGLSSDRPSAPTRELLTRLELREAFDEDPDATLATLREGLAPTGDADRLFALSELSFLQAERTHRADAALAAAVYAYAFLFASEIDPTRDAFDPRIQIARHLYNRGLTRGLATPDRHKFAIASGRHPLAFGTVDVVVEPGATDWFGWQLENFLPAADFRVRGLQNRYRQAGIGAPLSASLDRQVAGQPPPGASHVAPRLRVPVTAFLRFDDVRVGLASGHLVGHLELYSEDQRSKLEVNGRAVPLELEKSSSFAAMLEGAPIWDFGLAGFRLGDYLPVGGPADRLVMLYPYQPGRIPLVLVHGTFSSPATWAQLVNELENDPEISKRYQIWLFIYNSGSPVPYSGGILVATLRDVVKELDPNGTDRALHEMVVVGHSQGGLLTKLTVVNSGNHFWDRISKRPLDQLELPPESRELLQRSLFFEALPFVKRVVFMSTPHHGSYLSDFKLVSWLARLVQMPARVTKLMIDLTTHGGDEFLVTKLNRMPTSLDNMASNNRFLRALAELPIAPGVQANSIIALRSDGPALEGGDGVVKYKSAHIDGVESEKVVFGSGHSVQEKQEGIQELRRILLEHAGVAREQAPH